MILRIQVETITIHKEAIKMKLLHIFPIARGKSKQTSILPLVTDSMLLYKNTFIYWPVWGPHQCTLTKLWKLYMQGIHSSLNKPLLIRNTISSLQIQCHDFTRFASELESWFCERKMYQWINTHGSWSLCYSFMLFYVIFLLFFYFCLFFSMPTKIHILELTAWNW